MRKSFSSGSGGEPIVFDVDGEQFVCRPSIPAGLVLQLGELSSGAEGEEGGPSSKEAIKALRKLFKAALYPADHEKFLEYLDGDDSDKSISMATLMSIASWLAGAYAGDRPTGQPSAPMPPSVSSGDGSTGTTSVEGATYSLSTPTALSTS